MTFKTIARALAVSALLSVSAVASAAPTNTFAVSSTSFVTGTGYGTGNAQLDVDFTLFALPSATDLLQGQSFSFQFGSVNFKELCVNGAGEQQLPDATKCPKGENNGNERDGLEVTALVAFSQPLNTTVPNVAVTGAFIGQSSDTDEDFFIRFKEEQISFGNFGGLFTLELADLHFSGIGAQTLWATITLDHANIEPDVVPPNAVPEPGSLALLGLGIAAFGFSRRRVAK